MLSLQLDVDGEVMVPRASESAKSWMRGRTPDLSSGWMPGLSLTCVSDASTTCRQQ